MVIETFDGIYLHAAYATDAAGSDFSLTWFDGALYLGNYSDSSQTESTNPAMYRWHVLGETELNGEVTDLDMIEENETEIGYLGEVDVDLQADSVENAENVQTAVEGLVPMTSHAGGAIANFEDLLIKDLVADIGPVQDLNGYSKPWVGGAGKNKLPMNVAQIKTLNTGGTWSGNTYTRNGVSFELKTNSAGAVTSIVATGTASAETVLAIVNSIGGLNLTDNTHYAISAFTSGQGGSTTYELQTRQNNTWRQVNNANGNTMTYVANTSTNDLVRCIIRSGYEIPSGGLTFYPMIRLSSVNDAIFEPYTNICPISGFTTASISRTSINVCDEVFEAGGLNGVSGQPATIANRVRTKNFNPCKGGESYYIYCGTEVALRVFWYDITKTFINRTGNVRNEVVTAPSNAYYFKLNTEGTAYGETYRNDISMNYPSTDTSYHAYTGDVYTIDLGRTVYKGTLDVTTGLLTVTCESITFDGSNDEGWNGTATDSGTGIRRFYTTKSYAPNNSIVACDSYVIGTSASAITQQTDGIIIWDSGRVGVSPSWAQGMTLAQFKTGLASQPFQIVKELATPLTYQLTPTQIATLNGVNNLWSNTGEVSIELVAIRDDIEKIEEVSKLASDTAQNFWFTGTGTDTGAHITEIPREDFETDPANGGGNLLARSNGIAIRDGLDEVATFSADGITMKDSEQNEIFDVSVRSGNITHILRYGYASSDGYGGVINLGRSIDTFTSLSVTYHPSADPTDITTLDYYSLPISIALSDTDLYALYVTQTNASTLDISFYSKDSDGFGELICDNITIEYTTTQITSEMDLGAYPDDTLTAPLRVGNGTAANAKSNAFAVDFAGNAYFSGNDIRINCNADSSGGTSLIRGERFNGYYLSDSTAFVVIDVYKVGRLVNLLVTCQRTYAVTVGSNFFSGQVPRVPRPAMEIATGAGFYGTSVIGGFLNIDANDVPSLTVRNVAGSTVNANAAVYCTITYVAEE